MKRNRHANRWVAVAADGAVDPDHPLNKGRTLWWCAPPGIPTGGGRVVDLCGSKHATVVGILAWPGTPWGTSGQYFSGTNYAFGNLGTVQLSQVTMSAWVRNGPSVGAASMQVCLGSTASNNPAFAIEAGSDVGSPTSVLNIFYRNDGNTQQVRTACSGGATNWARIVVTLDTTTGTQKGYINGQLAGTSTGLTGTLTATNLAIGGWLRQTGLNSPSNCTVADVSLYLGFAADTKFAALDYQHAVAGYRGPDSPLQWLRRVSYSLPPRTPVHTWSSVAWADRSVATATNTAAWQDRTRATASVTAAHSTRARTSSGLTADWADRARADVGVAAPWETRLRVLPEPQSATWPVRATAGRNAETPWSLLARLNPTLTAAYADAIRVDRPGELKWSDRANFYSQLAAAWPVYDRTTAAGVLAWADAVPFLGTLRLPATLKMTSSIPDTLSGGRSTDGTVIPP